MNWLVLLLVSVLFVVYQFLPLLFGSKRSVELREAEQRVDEQIVISPAVAISSTPRPRLSMFPFTSQAPFGEWSDKRFQDGCEEASVLMAYCAVNIENCMLTGEVIDRAWAKEKLLDMYQYQVDNWGFGVDTSARDTADRLLMGYFNYASYEVKEFRGVNEIVAELNKGMLVIVPTDGRLLFNPNFTNGGPERHMLLIIGYDEVAEEFITNDPGTRLGRNYRYDKKVMFEAVGDYLSGDHEQLRLRPKLMIVVG